MTIENTSKTERSTPSANETQATAARYEAPRITKKQSLQRVTLASSPGAGQLGPGGVIGGN